MTARARIATFLVILLVLAGSGLAYVYSRPPVYGGHARLSVEPPAGLDPAQRDQFASQEAQALQGAELSGVVSRQLAAGVPSAGEVHIHAAVVPQTQIVELRVEAGTPAAIVAAMNAWIEAYGVSRRVSDRALDEGALERGRRDVEALRAAATAKRGEAEQFRRQHDIVSIERDENAAAARLKGAQAALNDATTREVNAEARLEAVSESLAEGRAVVRAADKQTLGSLEMRAVELRERLRDMEHDYTAQYLAMDPRAKSLRANLARIEQQIDRERERSQRAALVEAEEELAATRAAANRLREQIDARRQETVGFGERFAQFKRLTLEADQADVTLRAAAEQLVRLEVAQKGEAGPRIRVLVPPSVADTPLRPDYHRDAGVAGGVAFGTALLVVWLVDFLMRPAQRPAEPVPQPIIQIAYPMLSAGPQGMAPMTQATLPPGGGGAALPMPMPRELAQEEIGKLWAASAGQARVVLAALLHGLAIDEVAAIQWEDLDTGMSAIQVRGASARSIPLFEPLRSELMRVRPISDRVGETVLCDASGAPLSAADVEGLVTCTVRDAGLTRPDEVDSNTLRHTFVAFLARQGARLADIPERVGWIPPAVFNEYGRLSPPGPGIALANLDPVMPVLRNNH